jgi:hypothetical protein
MSAGDRLSETESSVPVPVLNSPPRLIDFPSPSEYLTPLRVEESLIIEETYG